MSIAVAAGELGPLIESFGWGYLLTTGERPRVEAHSIECRDGALHIAGVGQTSMANLSRRPRVTVVFPPVAGDADARAEVRDGYTLIVDGEAVITSRAKRTAIAIRPTNAVFHRPAPGPTAHAAD